MPPKAKNNGVAVIDAPVSETQPLLRINFDDLDNLETIEPEPVQDAAPSEPDVDTEAQVLSTVETFDKTYAADPLKEKWRAFGEKIKQHVDNTSDAIFYLECGRELGNLAIDEHNLAPNSYDRAVVMKKAENVLRLCQVPESMARPQELTAVFALVMLDCSIPSTDPSEPRTFNHEITISEWVRGNITMGSLRVLAKVISRASKANELDSWDYREGYENWTRSMVKRLRAGELSVRQLERLLDAKKKALTDAKKREKYAGLTTDEIASIELAERNATLQGKLTELASQALTLQKYGAEELKKGPADLKEFLVNRQIIPADNAMTPKEYASRMTPGDAKALVQALIDLYPTQPDRLQVFKALNATCRAVVEKLRAAQESAKTAKVA
jgi:hypothetical protein